MIRKERRSSRTLSGIASSDVMDSVRGAYEAQRFTGEMGLDVNKRDEDGRTPIWMAVLDGRSDVVEVRLKNGADVNERIDDGLTPIWTAVLDGRADVVGVLVTNGASRNEKRLCRRPESLLEVAVTAGHCTVAEVLMCYDAFRYGTSASGDGETALHDVTDTEYAVQLLQDGADANAFSMSAGTPLHSATKNGRAQVAAILVRFERSSNTASRRCIEQEIRRSSAFSRTTVPTSRRCPYRMKRRCTTPF